MALPEDYWALPVEEIVELAVDAIAEDGLFWMPITRTPAQTVEGAVMEMLPDATLYLHSPPPDWDHVLIDIGRLPDWTEWVNGHAVGRFELKGLQYPILIERSLFGDDQFGIGPLSPRTRCVGSGRVGQRIHDGFGTAGDYR